MRLKGSKVLVSEVKSTVDYALNSEFMYKSDVCLKIRFYNHIQ